MAHFKLDPVKQIKESTDLEFLDIMKDAVNLDIYNVINASDFMKKSKASMRGMTIEESQAMQLDGLNNLKSHIEARIKELNDPN